MLLLCLEAAAAPVVLLVLRVLAEAEAICCCVLRLSDSFLVPRAYGPTAAVLLFICLPL